MVRGHEEGKSWLGFGCCFVCGLNLARVRGQSEEFGSAFCFRVSGSGSEFTVFIALGSMAQFLSLPAR